MSPKSRSCTSNGNSSSSSSLSNSSSFSYSSAITDERREAADKCRRGGEGGIEAVAIGDISENMVSSRTTPLQTFVHLFKGYVGPGCLSLPWAFSQLGISLGSMITIALFVITSYNSMLLVNLRRKVVPNQREVTYSDVGEILCGAPLRHFITLSVCAQQLGICTVYFSFVADNINAVVLGSAAQKANTDGSTSSSFIGHDTILGIFGSYHVVVTCVLPFALLLTFIPNLKQLAKVTEIATVFLFVTFALLVGVIIENLDGRRNRTEETNIYEIHWAMVPMAVCVILYAYEGINLILPVESAMIDFQGFELTFCVAMLAVCVIFIIFGTLWVSTFGTIDNGSITAFLIEHSMLVSNGRNLVLAANAVVSFSVLFTYPLQMFPCIGLFGEMIERRALAVSTALGSNDENKELFPVVRGAGNGQIRDPAIKLNSTKKDGTGASNALEHLIRCDTALVSTSSCSSFAGARQQLMEPPETYSPPDDEGNHNESSTTIPGDSLWMRAALVLSTYVVAMSIPNVQQLIALVGALSGSLNALIIPPILQLKYASKTGDSTTNVVLCCTLLGFGVVAGAWGTVASIIDIFRDF